VAIWIVAGLALAVALLAWLAARRLGRRLEALTQSYWELRYDYTRLRSQVARLDPEHQDDSPEATPSEPAPTVSFVPLASIKKKS
jgi:uncharacterized membrane protein YjgN (DUF898 family)